MWHPTKPEIQGWFDKKAQEFAPEENMNYRLTIEEWLGRNIYYDIHEYLFIEFLIILYDWLMHLTFEKRNFQGGDPTCWIPKLIQ